MPTYTVPNLAESLNPDKLALGAWIYCIVVFTVIKLTFAEFIVRKKCMFLVKCKYIPHLCAPVHLPENWVGQSGCFQQASQRVNHKSSFSLTLLSPLASSESPWTTPSVYFPSVVVLVKTWRGSLLWMCGFRHTWYLSQPSQPSSVKFPGLKLRLCKK